MNVQRYDFSELKSPSARKDADGFLHDSPVVGRVGIQEYAKPGGGVRREFRPPEEVFHPDALASFKGKPVTVDHPSAGRVTSNNANRFTVGSMLGEGRADGDHVTAEIVIYTPDAMGDRRQLSLGYTAEVDETPGEWNGERYDAIQRNIRINHLSVVKVARAGPKARLNLDSADNAVLQEETTLINNPEHLTMTVKVKLDNDLEYDAAPEVKAALDKLRNDALETATKNQAKLDALTAERDTLKARVDAIPTEIEAAKNEGRALAAARTKLESVAADFKVKTDGLSDADLKKAIIKAVRTDADLDGKTDTYLDASIDIIVDQKADLLMAAQRKAVNGRTDSGSTKTDSGVRKTAAQLHADYMANLGKKAEA